MSGLRHKILRSRVGSRLTSAALRQIADRHRREICPIELRGPIRDDDLILITIVRDEELRLPDFIRHYRELGITRFAFVDNDSTDGSVDILQREPDIDLYQCGLSFPETRYGSTLITGLARHYGIGRWFLYADVDEHLIYDGCEEHGLRDLIGLLESAGRSSLPTMMLDMYSQGPISQATPNDNGSLLEVCPLFDSTGYQAQAGAKNDWPANRIIRYFGGPRQRAFARGPNEFRPELAKTPLVKWDRRTVQTFSHGVYPVEQNFGSPRGCLLHFKFLSDLGARADSAIQSKTFYDSSSEQARYFEVLQSDPKLSLTYPGSQRFESSQSLVDAGLMPPIDWG